MRDDNQQKNPLKTGKSLPIKPLSQTSDGSKAVVWQRIRECQDQGEAVVRDMNAAVLAFRDLIRSPCPMYLNVQKLASGAVYLRWRKSGVKGKQPYIQMEGKVGKTLLASLPPPLRQSCLGFHHRLIGLNFRHALLLAEQRRLEFYLQQLQVLEQLKAQYWDNSQIKGS